MKNLELEEFKKIEIKSSTMKKLADEFNKLYKTFATMKKEELVKFQEVIATNMERFVPKELEHLMTKQPSLKLRNNQNGGSRRNIVPASVDTSKLTGEELIKVLELMSKHDLESRRLNLEERKYNDSRRDKKMAQITSFLGKSTYHISVIICAIAMVYLLTMSLIEIRNKSISVVSTAIGTPVQGALNSVVYGLAKFNNGLSSVCKTMTFGYAECNDELDYIQLQANIDGVRDSIEENLDDVSSIEGTDSKKFLQFILFLIFFIMFHLIGLFVGAASGVATGSRNVSFFGFSISSPVPVVSPSPKRTIRTKKNNSRSSIPSNNNGRSMVLRSRTITRRN
jgi:hypothetical protein